MGKPQAQGCPTLAHQEQANLIQQNPYMAVQELACPAQICLARAHQIQPDLKPVLLALLTRLALLVRADLALEQARQALVQIRQVMAHLIQVQMIQANLVQSKFRV